MTTFETFTPSANGTQEGPVRTHLLPDHAAPPPETMVLPSGHQVQIDPADATRARPYRWRFNKGIGVTAEVDGKQVLLHRWLLGLTDPDQVVAFEDDNKLNVTRGNMHIVDRRQSARKAAALPRTRGAPLVESALLDVPPTASPAPSTVAPSPAATLTSAETRLAGALIADLQVRAYRVTTLNVEFEDGSGLGQLAVDLADPHAFVLSGELEVRVRNALTAAIYRTVEPYTPIQLARPEDTTNEDTQHEQGDPQQPTV